MRRKRETIKDPPTAPGEGLLVCGKLPPCPQTRPEGPVALQGLGRVEQWPALEASPLSSLPLWRENRLLTLLSAHISGSLVLCGPICPNQFSQTGCALGWI